METVIKKKSEYISIKCTGKWDPQEIKEVLLQIRDQSIKYSYKRIFINCLDFSAPEKDFHRYIAGKDVADVLPRPFKLAVLYPIKYITKFAENTATNRGANILVHHNKSYLLKWLLDNSD